MPFSIFKSKSPVGIRDQALIEFDMQWLVERIGHETILRAKMISIADLGIPIPDHSKNRDLAKRDLMQDVKSVAELMDVTVDEYSIKKIKSNTQTGLYEGIDPDQKLIFVNKYTWESHATYCKILVLIVADMFLSRHLEKEPGDEHLWHVELTGVLLGGGIILANHTIHGDTNMFSGGNDYHLESRGVLTSIQLGYALALFANSRGEHNPKWMSQLRLDAKRSMENALRYIRRHEDRYFNAHSIYENKTSRYQLAGQLMTSAEDADQYIAMSCLWDWSKLSPTQKEQLEDLIRHQDPDIQCLAMAIASEHPDVVKEVEEELLDMSYADNKTVRVLALKALTAIELTHDSMKALSANLVHDNSHIVGMSCWIVANRANHATLFIPHLTEAMHYWISKCNFGLVHDISRAIVSIDDNAEAWLFERFGDGDPDFLHIALESYQNARTELSEQYERQQASESNSTT